MNKISQFDFNRFMKLSGNDVTEYTEPYLNIWRPSLPESIYHQLIACLEELDSVHLVYALEICMLLKPESFFQHVISFLSHSDATVFLAAYRLILRHSPGLMNQKIEKQIASTPVTNLYSRHVRTGRMICFGTNEKFIKEMIATISR
jgi:hypothetical protein